MCGDKISLDKLGDKLSANDAYAATREFFYQLFGIKILHVLLLRQDDVWPVFILIKYKPKSFFVLTL